MVIDSAVFICLGVTVCSKLSQVFAVALFKFLKIAQFLKHY